LHGIYVVEQDDVCACGGGLLGLLQRLGLDLDFQLRKFFARAPDGGGDGVRCASRSAASGCP